MMDYEELSEMVFNARRKYIRRTGDMEPVGKIYIGQVDRAELLQSLVGQVPYHAMEIHDKGTLMGLEILYVTKDRYFDVHIFDKSY